MQNKIWLSRLLAVIVVIFTTTFYLVGAALKPGFSQTSQFISELNATGTPWATEFSWFGFMPVGVLLAFFLAVSTSVVQLSGASRFGFLLLWSQPIAFIGVALAPCDPGCPIGGSPMQQLHDFLGLVTYLPAGLGFLLLSTAPNISKTVRGFFVGAGLAWFALFFFMLLPEFAFMRGLLQRTADALLGATLLVIAWRLTPPPQN